MIRSDLRDRARKCPSCGQLVQLLRNGSFRRHFTTDRNGRSHLCDASRAPASVVPRALRRLDP